MGDIGSAISGAGSAIGGGLGDAASGLGGFGNAMSGFGSMMNAFGGGGPSAGQAYGQGGVDPNTGQPIAQESPQTAQAQSQGPPAGTTPPGTDPATQIGGTQSRPQSSQDGGYASVLQRLAQNVLPTMPTPTQATEPGVSPSEKGLMDPAVSANPDSTNYDPNQGALPPHIPQWGPTHAGGWAGGPIVSREGMPWPQNEPGEKAPGSSGVPIGGGAGNVQEAPTGRESDPVANTGDLGKQYSDFLQGQGVGRPTATANLPAAGAQPVSAESGTQAAGGAAGGAPGAAQGGYGQDGGGMQNVMGNLMGMFLPMILGAMMGGGGGGMSALLPMMMMGGMMGRGGLGQMFGGRRMIPGFGGGMLRPGYYPDGRGGFGFHRGGWHSGWQPHYIGAYGNQPGGGGGDVTSAPQRGPWSNSPFLSTLVSAESGGRQGPGVRGDNGMAKGFFQFHDATWRRFARNVPGAGQYGSAEDAPPEVQQAVAMTAPISEWGPRTKQILHQRFGGFDERLNIGQLAQMFGGVGGGGGAAATGNAPIQQQFPSWAPTS